MQEWKGSTAEKALVSVHPERFEDVNQVARSVLFIIGNEVYGSRRNLGSLTLGIQMDKQSGDLAFTTDDKGQHANNALGQIIRTLGPIPQGFAELPEPKAVQRTKANKYTCPVCKTNVRHANHVPLQALCMHAGKPQYGQPAAQFEIQVKNAPAVPVVEQPKIQPPTPAENVQNVIKAVKAGAVKVVHGRNFGQEAATA